MEKLCLVIPCFNESERLDTAAFKRFVAEDENALLCLVDDGSSDNTLQILEGLKNDFPANITVVKLDKNSGKAEAVRAGFLRMLENKDVAYIGYFDADLSAPLQEAYYLKSHFGRSAVLELAFGSRIAKIGSVIERKIFRHLAGRIVATAIANILGLMIYDTQCGAKLFNRNLAEKVFLRPFVSRWLFDVEIFSRIIKLYGKKAAVEKILEVPLNQWTHMEGSKITASYSLKILWDLYRIKKASKQ